MSSEPFSPIVDDLVHRNASYAATFSRQGAPSAPTQRLAVVACMDARMDVEDILGIHRGEAHVIRNAGGVLTDDVVRSLVLSQRSLGTREVILLHHTKCGLHGVDESQFRADLEAELGTAPTWSLESFSDPFEDTQQALEGLRNNPFLPNREHITGFVYDVDSGVLHRVD